MQGPECLLSLWEEGRASIPGSTKSRSCKEVFCCYCCGVMTVGNTVPIYAYLCLSHLSMKLLPLDVRQWPYLHTRGRFKNHTACSLYEIMVMATSFMGVMKMWKIVPRAGLESTSLAFWASVLPLHHIGSLTLPLHQWLPVYVAPCIRGHCLLLHYQYSIIVCVCGNCRNNWGCNQHKKVTLVRSCCPKSRVQLN